MTPPSHISESDSPMHPMIALMLANTRAGALRAAAAGEPPIPQSVLKGAASHSGAFLLQALDEMGWQIVPKMANRRACTHCGVPLPADKPSHALASTGDVFCSACIRGAWEVAYPGAVPGS